MYMSLPVKNFEISNSKIKDGKNKLKILLF